MRTEIRLAGFGGQGIGLAGLILGKAVSLYDGLEAVMTQAYGPEARGGASSTNLVVADRPIDYPFVQEADILVTLSQEAYTRFRDEAKPEALVIIDEDLVQPSPQDSCLKVPATKLAEDLGRRIVANVVMLGFLTATTGLVERESIEDAIKSSVRENVLELNMKAFAAGYEYARKLKADQ
ncbi:MAG: 2-oxoacid:acceptor oxidoreductase family protein [Anaerolineaceae bacterium]|nr:MAG: 2-oxoacid:acceptor oxidoreductase family protein [Anaerolineaceae bacterium]